MLTARGVTAVADPDNMTKPVDATFDGVGGASLARSRRATKKSGTVVSFGVNGAASAQTSKGRAIGGWMLAMVRARITPGAPLRMYVIDRSIKKDPTDFRTDLTTLIQKLVDHQI